MIPQANTPAAMDEITDLTRAEREALLGAATWYANYHVHIIAELADDGSLYAVGERERFYALVNGLRKLGVRLPPPEIMAAPVDRAA